MFVHMKGDGTGIFHKIQLCLLKMLSPFAQVTLTETVLVTTSLDDTRACQCRAQASNRVETD